MEFFGATLGTFIWIACIIVCYLWADNWGRNKWGWALGAFFFGPITLLILGILIYLKQNTNT